MFAFRFARVLVIFSLALCVLRKQYTVNSRAVTMLGYTPMEHCDFDGCNCVAVVLQFLYRVRIWFVYRTFRVSPGETSPSSPQEGKFPMRTLEKYGILITSAHETGTEDHQPRIAAIEISITSGIQHDSTCAAVCYCNRQQLSTSMMVHPFSIWILY